MGMAPHLSLGLAAGVLLASLSTVSANPAPALSSRAGFSFDALFARWDCEGQLCGYNQQLCCTGGQACYTDSSNQAQCGAAQTQAGAGAGSGWVETLTTTRWGTEAPSQSTWAPATASISCNEANNESPCGNLCCSSGQYCYVLGTCRPATGGSTTSAGATTAAGAPILGTSSAITTVTAPSTTVPFETPVATGANVTLSNTSTNNSQGLSGGTIAGIVIGTLAGLALLALLCLLCSRRRKRRTVKVEEYERYSHRSHGHDDRKWYGGRQDRRHSHAKEAAGAAVGLAALWTALGFKKRREQRRHDDKMSEYTSTTSYFTNTTSTSEYITD
ncbi:hypothetical protein K470DRAFT_168565 [Piedraia hortae CBS 480.64]|uniref:Mid2 domain-containing protein n=1 Tax=Piedraia hortae CBS 480.64 TaxID=1314780 RepID=A0A6A7C6J9_9PEZI|nr:hypothetical protein K470DRAFT_168565 [Piedraia hortae CBS 480.64]